MRCHVSVVVIMIKLVMMMMMIVLVTKMMVASPPWSLLIIIKHKYDNSSINKLIYKIVIVIIKINYYYNYYIVFTNHSNNISSSSPVQTIRDYLLLLTPSAIEFELLTLGNTLEADDNVLQCFLEFMNFWSRSNNHVDLYNAILNRFTKVWNLNE